MRQLPVLPWCARSWLLRAHIRLSGPSASPCGCPSPARGSGRALGQGGQQRRQGAPRRQLAEPGLPAQGPPRRWPPPIPVRRAVPLRPYGLRPSSAPAGSSPARCSAAAGLRRHALRAPGARWWPPLPPPTDSPRPGAPAATMRPGSPARLAPRARWVPPRLGAARPTRWRASPPAGARPLPRPPVPGCAPPAPGVATAPAAPDPAPARPRSRPARRSPRPGPCPGRSAASPLLQRCSPAPPGHTPSTCLRPSARRPRVSVTRCAPVPADLTHATRIAAPLRSLPCNRRHAAIVSAVPTAASAASTGRLRRASPASAANPPSPSPAHARRMIASSAAIALSPAPGPAPTASSSAALTAQAHRARSCSACPAPPPRLRLRRHGGRRRSGCYQADVSTLVIGPNGPTSRVRPA